MQRVLHAAIVSVIWVAALSVYLSASSTSHPHPSPSLGGESNGILVGRNRTR